MCVFRFLLIFGQCLQQARGHRKKYRNGIFPGVRCRAGKNKQGRCNVIINTNKINKKVKKEGILSGEFI